MSGVFRIHQNSFFSFLSSATRLLANMFMFVGIARFYGTEAFGQFTTAHTYMTLFFVFADFGFDVLLVTKVAKSPSDAIADVQRFLPLKIIFSISTILAMCIMAMVGPVSEGVRLLMVVLSIGILGNALSNFGFALMKGYEQFHHETRVSFIQNVILLIGIIILGIIHAKLIYIASMFVVTRLLGIILILPRVFSILRINSLHLSLSGWRETFRTALPFGLHLIFGTIYFQIDTALLAAWSGDKSVGLYQAAMKLIVLILVIPDVITGALLPTLSRLHNENIERWRYLGHLLLKTLFYIVLPIALILFLYADNIIGIVYGHKGFESSIPVLKLFAFLLFLRFTFETNALMLTTSRNQTTRMKIVIFATILNLAMNYFAIPRYGIMGAAVVSLVTNAATSIFYIATAHKQSFTMRFIADTRQVVIVVFTALLGVALSVYHFAPFFLGISVIILSFSLMYYYVGYTHDERSIVFGIPKLIS